MHAPTVKADAPRGRCTPILAPLLVATAWLLAAPEPVAAWGPATHIALGEVILSSLYLLPPAIQAVLARYPLHFLYGSVAADLCFVKKYVPEGGIAIAGESVRRSSPPRGRRSSQRWGTDTWRTSRPIRSPTISSSLASSF